MPAHCAADGGAEASRALQSEALPSAAQLAEKKDGGANPFDGFTYVEPKGSPLEAGDVDPLDDM